MGKINIYLASHFFDAGGTMKTQFLADNLRSRFGDKIDLYVPQENGDINDKTQVVKYVTDIDIAAADNERLDKADILIADLDGVEIDSGVSAEIGYVAGRNSIKRELAERSLTGDEIKHTEIIGFTSDMRLNKTTDMVLKDLAKGNSKEKIDNLKDNHLYRNLYTRGLVEKWGTYIQTNPNTYIDDIIEAAKQVIENKGGLDA